MKQSDQFRFLRLNTHNCLPFKEDIEILFSENTTIISGDPGTGKTTISKMLSGKIHPEELEERKRVKNGDSATFTLVAEGDPALINQYNELVFINGDGYPNEHTSDPHLMKCYESMDSAEEHLFFSLQKHHFNNLLIHKPWKIDAHEDLSPKAMSLGERICLYLSTIFALREVHKVCLPIVLNAPFGFLDARLRESVYRFLVRQMCQKIFLVGQNEIHGLNIQPDYILPSID